MTYLRTIPRDLFNEANLLKCYGQLWLLLEQHRGHLAELSEGDGAPFDIRQDPADGSITVANLPLTISGRTYRLYRPLNSREPWPLYVALRDDEAEVFTDQGQLSPAFLALIGVR